jgi:4,5-DOPA dioxygenase extradiol
MSTQPTLFVSHGSPMHAVHAGRAGELWRQLGTRLPRPSAILIASAHWETELPMAATSRTPETIHDFGGFPPELYRIKYPTPGAPGAAERALALMKQAGFVATANGCRGLDHGAWVPLLKMYPDADVPTAQISVQPSLGPAHHLRVGSALAPLAQENVLVIGSGHMTHNLGDWMRTLQGRGRAIAEGDAAPYVEEFRRWVDARLQANNRDELVRYRELAPSAQRAHPSDEHFLPLFVALGAAGAAPKVEHLDAGVDSGVLAMDAYLFWPQ